jgi:hypothetical protein
MNPESFVTSACGALPQQIRSIVLFGSAAAGDFVEGSSSYDLLVVVEPLGIDELEALAPTIRAWRNAKQPLPLLFTPAQLYSSTDAFALEFSEMQHARRVLFGDDPITTMKIDPAHVRMDLERELKGKSLALRDRYVLAAGNRQRIVTLLTESLSTFLSLFRASLRLYQADAPNHKLEALRALATHIDFDPQPLLRVAELRTQRRVPSDLDVQNLFCQYWQTIETVTSAVDQRTHSNH